MNLLVKGWQRVSFISIGIWQHSNSIIILEYLFRRLKEHFEEERYWRYERRLYRYMNEDLDY